MYILAVSLAISKFANEKVRSFFFGRLKSLCLIVLRIPDSYDAKIAKICNFWTSWPIFQLLNHLFWIDGLFQLDELQARMSRTPRTPRTPRIPRICWLVGQDWLCLLHNYQVSLKIDPFFCLPLNNDLSKPRGHWVHFKLALFCGSNPRKSTSGSRPTCPLSYLIPCIKQSTDRCVGWIK